MTKTIVRPSRQIGVVSELLSVYEEQARTFTSRDSDPARILNLRPSQLPFCAASYFVGRATMGTVDILNMDSKFYVDIGTAVHEVLQTYLGTSGRFLANWECKICGKKTYVTAEHECCDFPMKYHEIEIDHGGVVGHIDAVFIDRYGKYWILDFKTTSVAGASKKLLDPGVVYIEQVETYALMMKLQHKIRVEGAMLMFVKRDSPKKPIVWCKTISDERMLRIRNRTVQYKKWHKRTLNAETKADALALLEQGKCKNPYCHVCTSSNPKSLILNAYRHGKELGHLPLLKLAMSSNKTKKSKRTSK